MFQRRYLVAAAFVVLACCILTFAAATAQGASTIRLSRVDTTLYPTNFLNVTVLGPDGMPMENLKPENFKVLEDGKEQQVLDVAQSNQQNMPISVVMVLDCSGSMIPYMQDTKEAAKLFLQNLAPDDEAALISFSSTVVLESGFTTDKKILETAIDNLQPRDQTALYMATQDSLNLFREMKGKNKAVLVLTDGMNNGPGSVQECIDKSLQLGVPIYTIGLGELSQLDPGSLSQMATETGGVYSHAPTSADLANIYKSLAAQLKKQLWVKYVAKPTKWPRNHIRATVTLQGVPGAGASSQLTYVVPIQWWKIIMSFLLVELILIFLTYFLFRFFWKNMNMNPVSATQLAVIILTVLTMIWYTIMFVTFVPFLYFGLIGLVLLILLVVPIKMLAK